MADHEKEKIDEYILFNMNNWAGMKPVSMDDNAKSLKNDLNAILSKGGETFQERLFKLIDERGLSEVEVYQTAMIDRRLFSKIRSNRDYKPKFETVILLSLALQLDIRETEHLLSLAGYSFSDSKRYDLIIKYCIENDIYSIKRVNNILEDYNEMPLKY